MTVEELYNKVLDDFHHGNVSELRLIKDLIMLLEPEALQKFAEMWGYFDMGEE